jgi:hypothetical protein
LIVLRFDDHIFGYYSIERRPSAVLRAVSWDNNFRILPYKVGFIEKIIGVKAFFLEI